MDLNKLFERVSSTIYENEDFLIATHIFPDGDALGSLMAVYELIRSLKKNAFFVYFTIIVKSSLFGINFSTNSFAEALSTKIKLFFTLISLIVKANCEKIWLI